MNTIRLTAACLALFATTAVLAQKPIAISFNQVKTVGLWSNPATWGGSVPVAGDDVTIPVGKIIFLNIDPPPLGSIDIHGSLIVFDRDMTLTANRIIVHGTGLFELGTESSPFTNLATITLSGDAKAMPMERTFMVMPGGQLELHGEPRSHSWLQLDTTADAGRSLITLTEPVDWRVGEKIVIASTDFDPDQTEERTITAISNGNRSLNLDVPLTYTHWGEFESGIVDERGEVALMSRNIVIRGDDTSTLMRTGGHMMFMADKYLKSSIHIDWVELTEMGWEGVLARYPMHFHECGDMAGAYIRSTSTHHCFSRVISIHNTNGIAFEDNFGFDTVGHMFYLEDGLEKWNVFARNLGILARTPDPAVQLKESDSEPSIFYITNLENTFIDNVAVGSDADGFWYHIPNEQWGNLYALIYAMPTTFSGNVAHSNRRHGFYTDERVLAQDNDYPDFTAYKNNHFGVYLRTRGTVYWTNAHIADNASGFYPATEGIITLDDFQGTIVIDSCHFIGESNNIGTPDTPIEIGYGRSLPEYHGTGINPTNELSGIELYDGLTICLSTTFENFQQASYAGHVRNAGAFTGVAYENPWAIDPLNTIIAGTFINANPIYFRTATLEANGIRSTMVYDYDGSISGVPGTTYTADNPFFDPLGQSTFIPDYNALEAPPTSSFAQLLFQIGTLSQQLPIGVPDFVEYQLGFNGTGPTNYSGTPFEEPPGNLYDVFTTNLPVGSDVDVLFPDGAVLPDFTIGFRCSAPGESIIVRVPLAEAPTNITYHHWAALGPVLGLPVYEAPAATDLAKLRTSQVTAFFYDADAGYLYLKPVLTTSFTNPGGTTIFDGGSTYIFIEL